MDDFDLKPPEPPKSLKVKEDKKPKAESTMQNDSQDTNKDTSKQDTSKKRGFFGKLFKKKEKPVDKKPTDNMFDKLEYKEGMAGPDLPPIISNEPVKDNKLITDTGPDTFEPLDLETEASSADTTAEPDISAPTMDFSEMDLPKIDMSEPPMDAKEKDFDSQDTDAQDANDSLDDSFDDTPAPPSMDADDHKDNLEELRKKLGLDKQEIEIPDVGAIEKEDLSFKRQLPKAVDIAPDSAETFLDKPVKEREKIDVLSAVFAKDDLTAPPQFEAMNTEAPAKDWSKETFEIPTGIEMDDHKGEELVETGKQISKPKAASGSAVLLSDSVTPLSDDEIKKIVASLEKDQEKAKAFNNTTAEYFDILKSEIDDIIKSPYNHTSLIKQKSTIKEKLKTLARKKKTPQNTVAIARLSKNLSIIEDKEQKLNEFNIPLFFKLYKATSLKSLVKLLTTIESTYKVDMNDIILTAKEDFQKVANNVIMLEKERNDLDLSQVKDELEKIADNALNNAKIAVDQRRVSLDQDFQKLINQKQDIEEQKFSIKKKQGELKDKESNMQIIIDNKISEMEKKFNDKEQLLNKEIEVKNQNIKKQLDEFKRTKKQQEIEVMSELQKVEASKVKLDEQSLSIENQRRALQKEREEFMKDKKTLKTTLTNEVRSLGDQKNLVLKEIDLERKRMRDMESQYDKKIRQEYFAKVKDLETRRKDFDIHRVREQDKLNKLLTELDLEKKDLTALKNELSAQEERVKTLISSQKNQIRNDLDEIRQIDNNLAKVEQNIMMQKESLEKEGFQKYLQAKLSNIDPISRVRKYDMPLVEDHEVEKALHEDLNQLINQCKQFIRLKDIQNSKTLYNEITEKFNQSDLTGNEKSLMYNMIRELYDDIHLMSLNRQ